MNQWVAIVSPYNGQTRFIPRRSLVQDLVRNGGYSPKQVKKILANKKVRSLAYYGME